MFTQERSFNWAHRFGLVRQHGRHLIFLEHHMKTLYSSYLQSVAAVISFGLWTLFQLFVVLFSQRVSSHMETLRELLPDPFGKPISLWIVHPMSQTFHQLLNYICCLTAKRRFVHVSAFCLLFTKSYLNGEKCNHLRQQRSPHRGRCNCSHFFLICVPVCVQKETCLMWIDSR